MAGEIFISYRRADQAQAKRLYELLKAEGVEAWYDAHVGAGQDWRATTAGALQKSKVFVLLFSKAAAASDDIAKELAAATFSKKLVVPVRIENIQPEGAFLYELASRNWIDAFEDTDARLAELAKTLAEQVKQGITSDSFVDFDRKGLSAPTRRHVHILRSRAWIASTGAIVLLVSLIIAGFSLAGGIEKTSPGRIAFFGIDAPPGDDETAAAAETTASTIRTTFAALQRDVAASADTTGIPAKDRLDRTLQLRAQYAVSGAATRRGDTISISILVEDAASRTTIWPAAFDGAAARPEALASRVAALLNDRVACIIDARSGLRKDDIRIVTRLPDACARTTQPDAADRWQDLANLAPDSAWVQSNLSIALFSAIARAAPTAIDDLRRRADEALARGEAIDPDLPIVFSARVVAARIRGDGLLKEEEIFRAGLATGRRAPNLYGQYSAFLWRAGRVKETEPFLRQSFALDPLSPPKILAMADHFTFFSGAQADAEAFYAQRHRQFPDSEEWQAHLVAALFRSVGDVDEVLRDPPPDASGGLTSCLTDLVRLVRDGGTVANVSAIKRMEACRASRDMKQDRVAAALALLGVFEPSLVVGDINNPSYRILFDPKLPNVRQHPTFLKLMQEKGFVDYWRNSGHPPDFCATESAPVCDLIKAK